MSAKDILASVLLLLGIVTAWPVILLVIILVFRHEIRPIFPALVERLKHLTKLKVAGASLEFAEVKALQDSIESRIEELKDKPDELVKFVKEQIEKLLSAVAAPSQPSEGPPLRGRSILWVDDIPSNNAYEESLFKQLGARIKEATSTEQAEPFLVPNVYDLIISDVTRGENKRAGYELLEEVKRRKLQTPFVFYTRRATAVNPKYASLANGVADSAGELRDLVLELLRR